MAAVLGRELGDERRLPEHAEGVRGRERRKTREQRVDEHDAPVAHDADVVDVEVARGVGDARDEVAVGRIRRLVGTEHVLEAPDLEQRGDDEPLRVGPQPHGARKVALVEGDALLRVDADEIEPARLVGGEGEADVVAQEPVGEAARAGDVDGLRLLRCCALRRWARDGRRAYAQVTPPNPPCDQISGGGTTITCTGDVSTGVSLVNGNGPYTTLNVNTLTTTITPADGVYGIEFTSNDDVTLNSNTGAFGISTTNATGIYAYSQGGQITVDSTGDIAANGGGGISVNRNGGLTNVLVTSVGNITSTFTGISVSSGQSTGDITVDSTGDITSTNSSGIKADNDGYGNVSVTSSGTLVANNTGIRARASYDNVTVVNTGDITAANQYGIYARSSDTGIVSVTSSGTIQAAYDGIQARSDSGAVTVNNTGNVTSTTARAIAAYNAGAGALTVTNVGNLTAASTGIRAASIGGAGTVTVNSTGDITITGANSSAILASTDGASAVIA